MLTPCHSRSHSHHVIPAVTHTMSFPQCFERESTHPPTPGFLMKTLRNKSPYFVHYVMHNNNLRRASLNAHIWTIEAVIPFFADTYKRCLLVVVRIMYPLAVHQNQVMHKTSSNLCTFIASCTTAVHEARFMHKILKLLSTKSGLSKNLVQTLI